MFIMKRKFKMYCRVLRALCLNMKKKKLKPQSKLTISCDCTMIFLAVKCQVNVDMHPQTILKLGLNHQTEGVHVDLL